MPGEADSLIVNAMKRMTMQFELPVFTYEKGDVDHKRWIQLFRYAIEQNGWNTKHAIMMLQLKLQGKARQKADNLDGFVAGTTDALITELSSRFEGRKGNFSTFLQTSALRQMENESQERWAARVKATAARAGTDNETLALGVFIQGQYNPKVREKLYDQTGMDTMKDALESAVQFTEAQKLRAQGHRIMQGNPNSTMPVGVVQPQLQSSNFWGQDVEPMEIDALRRATVCYRCGKKGHFRKECRVKLPGAPEKPSRSNVYKRQQPSAQRRKPSTFSNTKKPSMYRQMYRKFVRAIADCEPDSAEELTEDEEVPEEFNESDSSEEEEMEEKTENPRKDFQ